MMGMGMGMGKDNQFKFVLATLLIFFFIALDSMWGLIHRNGYYEALRRIRDDGPRFLPGSSTPIRARYTGLALVDYWLAVMNTVLANVQIGKLCMIFSLTVKDLFCTHQTRRFFRSRLEQYTILFSKSISKLHLWLDSTFETGARPIISQQWWPVCRTITW